MMTGRWQFDWRLLLFTGLMLPLLLSLGVWQLQRAGEKAILLEAWQSRDSARVWASVPEAQLQTGQRVAVTGWYDEPTWLLDNRTRDGRAGYEVLTLFQSIDGPPVVINRGWVPAPPTRAQLPLVTTPEGVFTLQGRVADYPEPPVLGQPEPSPSGWPRRVQALPRSRVSSQVADPSTRLLLLADSQQPGAYRADKAPDVMGPQTHYGYASQWFALAAVLTILTLVASYKKTTKDSQAGADNDNDNG